MPKTEHCIDWRKTAAEIDADYTRMADEHDQYVHLRRVLLGLLTGCAAVLRTIDPDDSDEAEKLADLLAAIDRAQAPSRHQGALL